MSRKPNIDDNPEWTEADFNKAGSPHDILSAEVLAAFPNTRGAQKKPVKVPVSIRLSQDVVNFYKSTGRGWQSRIDMVLKKAAGLGE